MPVNTPEDLADRDAILEWLDARTVLNRYGAANRELRPVLEALTNTCKAVSEMVRDYEDRLR